MTRHFLLLSLLFFASTFSCLVPTVTAVDASGDTDFTRARVAVSTALDEASAAATYLSQQTAPANKDSGKPGGGAVKDCFTNLEDAVDMIRDSFKQMQSLKPDGDSSSVRFEVSNVQTWMSTALTNADTCTDGLEGEEGPLKTNISDRLVKVKKLISNALALVNDFAKTLPTN
ncbi:hypothetical protein VNO80_23670 [Phaseolus coccineus]|uniref:Pectinesterase inhibitor domain-containing protein n=1 Tax=Phaseolus coccineus TaxID=3886 RepID=A0AAN9QVU2_PHACN